MCRQTAAGLSLSFYLTVHLDRKRELLDELIQKYGHFLLVRSPPKSSSGTPPLPPTFSRHSFFFFFDSFILFFFLLKSKWWAFRSVSFFPGNWTDSKLANRQTHTHRPYLYMRCMCGCPLDSCSFSYSRSDVVVGIVGTVYVYVCALQRCSSFWIEPGKK